MNTTDGRGRQFFCSLQTYSRRRAVESGLGKYKSMKRVLSMRYRKRTLPAIFMNCTFVVKCALQTTNITTTKEISVFLIQIKIFCLWMNLPNFIVITYNCVFRFVKLFYNITLMLHDIAKCKFYYKDILKLEFLLIRLESI